MFYIKMQKNILTYKIGKSGKNKFLFVIIRTILLYKHLIPNKIRKMIIVIV